jgi:peptide/nickel transport system substrate-binding protein
LQLAQRARGHVRQRDGLATQAERGIVVDVRLDRAAEALHGGMMGGDDTDGEHRLHRVARAKRGHGDQGGVHCCLCVQTVRLTLRIPSALGETTMKRWCVLATAAILGWAATGVRPGTAAAQTKPEGEMRWALYVTLAPAWLDPGESVVGVLTPFWVLYALHDALVKPMPGQRYAASLAESWTASEDQRVYSFTLRPGLKFHNGDPFTAEDVKFSFMRAKGALLHQKVKEVVVVDPTHVDFVLHEPWPDFMTFYGTFASGAGWIVPKNYVEKVGGDEFKRHPVGLGPYKFVSNKPGIELVMEAYEGYWRKIPSVKRLVFKSIPESTTRLAMLKRDEVDVAYLLDGSLAEEVKRDPKLKLAFSGGIGTFYLDFFDMWDPKSPWADERVRRAASLAIDRHAISEAETLGASPPTGSIVPKAFEYALPMDPDPYDPAQAKKLLAEAGYPNGFDAGDLYPWPPYFSTGEAIIGNLGAIGIRSRMRTMERAAFYAALGTKKLKGLCMCVNAVYGNASSRLSETVPSDGAFAYGGYPDVDDLYKRQAIETDAGKREAMLHQIQRTLRERTRFAPIYDYIWASGVGPRVEDAALMKIDPYPWSAPLEEVRLKRP